jgi:GDP-L-fucose synthase
MDKNANILIVGHNDIIENALYQSFQSNGFTQVVSSSAIALNTAIQPSVYEYFAKHKPQYIFLGSVRSGGIETNVKNPAEFLYQNSESQNNIIHSAYRFGVKKLIYFAASCIYPKNCPQPIKEEHLLTGPLEETSAAYSVAKIAGVKLCQGFRKQYGLKTIVIVPATIYGPGSDTNLTTAHVMGALIGKFVDAACEKKQEVTVWGSGNARREFVYADDFVNACLFLTERYDEESIVHVGTGTDVSIKELAQMIADAAGFKGKIVFDASKPDGTMQKLLDNSRLSQMGWKAKTSLKEGIQKTVDWYRKGSK